MFRIFKKQTDPRVQRLYDEAVRGTRTALFYERFGVADTLDGRFDMLLFHLTPLINGMRDDTGQTTPEGQALFDTFVSDMEQNLRTIGASDTTFPKKMKKIGQSFYGRLAAYREGLGDETKLRDALARNILDDPDAAGSDEVAALAAYYRAVQSAADKADLLAGFRFPDPLGFAPPTEMQVGADRESV